MTQTTQAAAPPTGPDAWRHPGGVLLRLIAALLAPIFLGVTAGDVTLARMAAIETINDYRARNNADLVAVAQIVGCGLAALGSLSQSMADDLSLSMTLRLRGNAVALNRSAEQNRRVLNAPIRDDPNPIDPAWALELQAAEDHAQTEPEPFLSPAAEQHLAAESLARLEDPSHSPHPTRSPAPLAAPITAPKTAEKRHQEMWAIAMANEASEISASIPNLPPAERAAASVRAAALSSTANQLLTGGASPPALRLDHRLPTPT